MNPDRIPKTGGENPKNHPKVGADKHCQASRVLTVHGLLLVIVIIIAFFITPDWQHADE